MKLAEALSLRADLQNQINMLTDRLDNNATVQEGEKPAEDPQKLIKQLNDEYKQLEELMVRINLTNASCKDGDTTLTALLARRECQSRRLQALRSFLDSASATASRATHTEIKILSTVNVATMQKQLEQDSKQLRQLDTVIQQLNWTTELQ